MIIYLMSGSYEIYSIKTIQCFPEPYESFDESLEVELDLSDYRTNANMKGSTYINTSMLTSRTDLADLNTEPDDLGVDKLKTVFFI